MPLVHVADCGPSVDGVESAQAADPEHDLLPDSSVIVAPIKLVGDVAVLGPLILRDVGVEQVEARLVGQEREGLADLLLGRPEGAAADLDQRIEATSQGRNFIAKQLDVTKARLEESEEQLHKVERYIQILYRDAVRALSPGRT